ncbi:Dicer-like protein 2 [Elasticomyces elasticus]|nr:Dicer-like protein 2 [Elasticomyces elasticus]
MSPPDASFQLYDVVSGKMFRRSFQQIKQHNDHDFKNMKSNKDDLQEKDFADLDWFGIATQRRGLESEGGWLPSADTMSRAMLNVDSTLQHLLHFCQLLQRDTCIDPGPDFSFHEDQNGRISASVTLPHSIPARARHAQSKRTWRTEKAPKKDAAFHAYAALFEAGLLNDHLLPIRQELNINEGLEEAAPPARLQIEPSDPWACSKDANDWYKLEIQIISQASFCPNYEPPVHVVLNTYQQPSTPTGMDTPLSRLSAADQLLIRGLLHQTYA